MGLDHVADPQGVDVKTAAQREGTGSLFVDYFGECVAVHRIDIVFFVERKISRISHLVGENKTVSRFAGRNDDLADAELYSSLDHIVGAERVDAEKLVIWRDHDARDGGKMNNGIDGLRPQRRIEFVQACIAGQCVENLPAVGDIRDQCPNARIVEPLRVDIENLVAPFDEILDNMPSSFAAPAGEHDPLRHLVLHVLQDR